MALKILRLKFLGLVPVIKTPSNRLRLSPKVKTNQMVEILSDNYRHLDIGPELQNFSEVRKVMIELPKGVKRNDLFISSTVTLQTQQSYIRAALSNQMKMLGLPYIDRLFLEHRGLTASNGEICEDMKASIIAQWKGMEECMEAGKVGSIGVRHFNSQMIQQVLSNCTIKPAVVEINPLWNTQTSDILSLCRDNEIEVASECKDTSQQLLDAKYYI